MGIFNSLKELIKERFEKVEKTETDSAPISKENNALTKYAEYVTPQGYVYESSLREMYNNSPQANIVSFSLYLVVSGHNNEKLPFIYFLDLISNFPFTKDPILTNFVTDVLCAQGKPFIIDENGEPKDRENALTPEEVISMSDNPVLAYVSKFHTLFLLQDDIEGSVTNKTDAFITVVQFLAAYSGFIDQITVNKNIIADNPWIFDKKSYQDKLGVVMNKKSFAQKCVELSGEDPYFKMYLNSLE